MRRGRGTGDDIEGARALPQKAGATTGGARPALRWRGIAILIAAALVASSACSTTKPTELVPGMSTQVQVPQDLRAIQVEVDSNGRNVFCQGYDVDPSGEVLLPETLGVVSAESPETTVKVVIRGYDDTGAAQGTYNSNCPDPSPAGGPSPAPRVLRTSVQTFVDQHTLFLPMPLSYSCYDQDCSAPSACSSGDCVCKGAQCVDSATNALALADFDPSLINGEGLCFDPSTCFDGVTTAIPVDAASCIYAAPPGAGVNVRVFYEDLTITASSTSGLFQEQVSDSGESEILNEDPQEGFCLGGCGASTVSGDGGGQSGDEAGGAAPADASVAAGLQTFQLAPGLCGLVQAASAPPRLPTGNAPLTLHAISSVQVATGCPSKSPLLPICKSEQSYTALFADGATSDAGAFTLATSTLEETPDGAAITCGSSVPLASTPSEVYLIMDGSSVMSSAFGPDGYATAMSLSLADPVFDTTYTAFRFFPEIANDAGGFDQSQCTSSTSAFATPAVPFEVATQAQAQIAQLLRAGSSPDDTPANPAPLDLQAALRPDVGAYATLRSFLQGREAPNVAAVMAFVNRAPDTTNDCNPPLEGAATVQAALEAEIEAAYDATPSMRTYFVVLGSSPDSEGGAGSADSDGGSGALGFYEALQADLPQMVTVIDATAAMTQAGVQQVLTNFAQGVAQLGTCLYEPVAGATITQLGYTDPTDSQNLIAIQANAACNSTTQNTVDGWAMDNGRVRVCGASCTDIQNAIVAASAASTSGITLAIAVDGTVSCGDDGGTGTTEVDSSVATDGSSTSVTGSADATTDATSTADSSADGDDAAPQSVSTSSSSSTEISPQ